MKDYKLPKDTYSIARYESLHFAVAQYGTSFHREFWDMMVDAGLSKRKIFQSYMKMLRLHNSISHDILKEVGVRHFSFKMD